MPPVSVMIKPASAACNLSCEYCFYRSLSDGRKVGIRSFMTKEIFSEIAKKAFDFADGSDVWFSFQGGEPLLAGKDFFIHVFDEIKAKNLKKSQVFVGVQTNGTLIDEEWCNLFAANKVLVGLSLDGEEKNNSLRNYPDGKSSYPDVMRAVKKLKGRGVDFNILTVITKRNFDDIEKIYEFLKKNGIKYLQYIPCLSPFGEKKDYCLTGEEYGEFLKKAFVLYVKDYMSGNYVSVRIFDNFVKLAALQNAEQCGMNGHCTHQYVIESDGETYPCDFFCTDEYSLGNILFSDFLTMERSKKAIDFIKESLVKDEKCKVCPYYRLCAGGCKRERQSLDVCAAYKKFIPFALPFLRKMR